MTKRQAYYTLLFLLHKQFWTLYPDADEKEVFGLGELVSEMDPFMRLDRVSSDPATEVDFANAWEKVGNGQTASTEKSLEACFAFVDFYITEFEFKLDEAVDYLKSVDWKSAAQKFCALYPTDDIDIPNDNPFIEGDTQGELFDDEES